MVDCSICSPVMPYALRPPRNLICDACLEGARSVITFTNENKSLSIHSNKDSTTVSSTKGFTNALNWVKEMKENAEELELKFKFCGGLVEAYLLKIHTDILVKAGDGRPPIPAHKALLASKSSVLKHMLDSDACKAAPENDTITLSEMNHEDLEALLLFMYNASLGSHMLGKHVYALSLAADKYEIPLLGRVCEQHMREFMDCSNVLDVLEISETISNETLQEAALRFVVDNMEDVVFSGKFDVFALNNPHLTVLITRASFVDIQVKRNPIGYTMKASKPTKIVVVV